MGTEWITLSTRLLDNELLWEGREPFSKGQAWIDLLLLACHSDGSERQDGVVYKSILGLSDRWGWSRDRVRRFLAELEKHGACTTSATTHETTITLVNWGKYRVRRATGDTTDKATNRQQSEERIEERSEERAEQRREAEEKRVERREEKRKKEEHTSIHIPPSSSDEELPPQGVRVFKAPTVQDVEGFVAEKGYTNIDPESFVAFYESKGWMVGKNKMKDWKAAVRGWNSRHAKDRHAPQGRGPNFFDLLEHFENWVVEEEKEER